MKTQFFRILNHFKNLINIFYSDFFPTGMLNNDESVNGAIFS